MSAELGTGVLTRACGNVYHAWYVELHETEGRLVCKVLVVSPQVKMPSEITSRREDDIEVNRTEAGCVWDGFIWHRTKVNAGLL
jgi:hypothetical protein